MLMYFRKRPQETVVNDDTEQIVGHTLKVIRPSDSQAPGNDNGSSGESNNPAVQPQSSSKKKQKQGSLLINATWAPVDIRHRTDLSLLN
jgi:hypothetical protein